MRKVAFIAISIIMAFPALAYDRREAAYVTSSQNPQVLDYVVCLERAVGNAPRKLSIPQALDRAEGSCKTAASRLPKGAREPSAQDIRMNILECGFRAGDASPDMGCR
jgi:hypothetical protein